MSDLPEPTSYPPTEQDKKIKALEDKVKQLSHDLDKLSERLDVTITLVMILTK